MENKIKIPTGIYRHYKGGVYEVIGNAIHSETLEGMVVYKSLENGGLWVRPSAMWNETVTVNGKEVKRFSRV